MKSFFSSLFIVLVIGCLGFNKVSAQVGIGTTTPNTNAVLELKSAGNNQGFLVPRLTTAERTAMSGLSATEKGLLVFDTNDNKFYYWSGSSWIVIEDSVGTGTVTSVATGAGLTGGPISVTGTISLADNGVTTVKINNDAVTGAKILDGTVASADISDGTIATADLANGAVTDAKIGTGITVAKLSASSTAGQVLTTVGTTTTWATLPDASATNEIQDLSLTANTLSLSGDATTVNLAPYLDNTDNQDLSLAGSTLSLTNDGTTVNLSSFLDNTDAQALTFTSPNLSISGGNSVNLSTINTDAQTLTFTSPNLSISGGNSINLSAINTDNQDLTLASNTLSLTGDATTVSLVPYLDNTDNQDLSLAGSTLSLTNDGTAVSLSAFLDNTDAQTLSFTSPNLSISGGNSINLSTINTDNQDLSLAGNTLSLTNDGTNVSLAAYLDNTDAQTLTFTPATSALAISGGNSVTVTATGTAGGDLNGSFPNPTVDGLQGRTVASTLPSTGQVLEWNGSAWAPGTDDSGGGGVSGSGTSGQVAYWSGGTSITGNSNLLWDEKDNLLGIGITPKTNLHLGGSHAAVFTVAKDGTHTVDPKDYIIICAPGTTDILLPDAAEIPGRILFIRATDPKAVTIRAANGKDTIDGQSNLQIADTGDGSLYAVILISIGTDKWLTLNRGKR